MDSYPERLCDLYLTFGSRLGKLGRISHFDHFIEITSYRHLMSTRCLPLLKIILGRCIFYTQPAQFSLDLWQPIGNVICIFSFLELLKCKRLFLQNTSTNLVKLIYIFPFWNYVSMNDQLYELIVICRLCSWN